MLLSGATSFLAALAFLLVSATAVLANIEERKEALGYLSLLSVNVSAALGLVTANVTWHWALGSERYAVVAGLAGLIEVSLGALLGLITREEGPRKPLRSYVWPLRQLGLIVAAVAVGLCAWRLLAPIEVQDTNTLIEIAVALGSSAAAFAIGTVVVYSAQWLAFATVWTAVAAYFCGVLGVLRLAHVARLGATMDIALAAGSLLLFAVWHQLRISYYRKPLLYTALALVMIAGPVAYALWQPSGHVALALALCGLALVAIIGEIPRASLVHLSLVAFFGVWLKGLDQALGFLGSERKPVLLSGHDHLQPGLAERGGDRPDA